MKWDGEAEADEAYCRLDVDIENESRADNIATVADLAKRAYRVGLAAAKNVGKVHRNRGFALRSV